MFLLRLQTTLKSPRTESRTQWGESIPVQRQWQEVGCWALSGELPSPTLQPRRRMAGGSPIIPKETSFEELSGAADITNGVSCVVLPLSWKMKIN